MRIKSDAKNGQPYQKWLFALSEILSKIGIGLISNFLLKARVLTILKWNRPVCHLFAFTRVSIRQNLFPPSDSEANRNGADAESPFPLFFSFSASFKNSSPRETVGKLSSFWDCWAESLFVSIIVEKYNVFRRANNGRSREKKNLAALWACAIEILSTLTYTQFDCAALLAMLCRLVKQ